VIFHQCAAFDLVASSVLPELQSCCRFFPSHPHPTAQALFMLGVKVTIQLLAFFPFCCSLQLLHLKGNNSIVTFYQAFGANLVSQAPQPTAACARF
jgi:hypothetical protein